MTGSEFEVKPPDGWPAEGPGAPEAVAFLAGLADSARSISLAHFRSRVPLETKADDSPVTVADRAVEAELGRRIRERFPGHAVFGEEFGRDPGVRGHTWVIDPIDGTKSFITGKPLFTTLIALVVDERPILSVVDAPALDERWTGIIGGVTRLNGAECRTSRATDLATATVYATTADMFSPSERARFDSLTEKTRFRCFGADGYAYGLLASGHVDLVVEADLKPYDFLALVPVVEGAGGVITDWNGDPLRLDSGGRAVAAASGRLHRLALEFLRGLD